MAGPSLAARLWALRSLRFTRLQTFALGLMAVGLVASLVLPALLFVRQWRYSTYMEVAATVKVVEPPTERAGQLREGSVTLDYTASGLPQTVTLATTRFDDDDLVIGNTVPLHVNPNKLGEVETENTWHTIVMTLIFTLISAGVAVLGGFLFRWLTPELQAEAEDFDDDDDIFEPMPERKRIQR